VQLAEGRILRSIKSNWESTWKGWRITDCLKQQYKRQLKEEEMLGNVKGDVRSVVRLRTGPRGLNLEIAVEEKEINLLIIFIHSHPDI
jgi:hypothetical protein